MNLCRRTIPAVLVIPVVLAALFTLAAGNAHVMTGSDIVHVPYKGEASAYTALLANEVQLALGISSSTRAPAMPEVPTIAEAGVRNYEFTS